MKQTHPLSLRMLTLGAALTTTAAAASDSWSANAAGNWNNTASWTGGNIPGSTAVLDSTDIATFGFTLTAGRIVTVDSNRNIGGITFSNTSAFGYTLSSGNLKLSNGGLIQSTGASGAHTDTISSAIEIQGDGGTATFTNSALNTRLMNIGALTGVSTGANVTNLTLNGANTGANAISGVVGDGSGGGKLSITKNDAGTWVLQNNGNTYSGGTTVNAGTLQALAANSLGTGPVTLAAGALHLVNNANTAFNNNVSVTGTTQISSTKVSGQSGNISHTLGTLGIGANTLTVAKFFNTNIGALTFGATNLTGVATFNTTFTSDTNQTTLTLGAITGAAATGITKTGTGTMFLSGNSPSFEGRPKSPAEPSKSVPAEPQAIWVPARSPSPPTPRLFLPEATPPPSPTPSAARALSDLPVPTRSSPSPTPATPAAPRSRTACCKPTTPPLPTSSWEDPEPPSLRRPRSARGFHRSPGHRGRKPLMGHRR
jgi:autotransporter-associated beta strand protein